MALDNQPIDLFALNKTWLDNTIIDTDVEIPGYNILRSDQSRNGGGVAEYILNTMNYKPRKDLENQNIETLWIKRKVAKSHTKSINLYHLPTTKQ